LLPEKKQESNKTIVLRQWGTKAEGKCVVGEDNSEASVLP